MAQLPRLVLVSLLLAGFTGSSDSWAQAQCPPGGAPAITLSATQKSFALGREVVIVALGSSSTEGWMASSVAESYPAQLQFDLEKVYPASHFAVINRGIGGEDAAEELARLDRDAIALKPDLVIWQVGANGAMEHADPDTFKRHVTTGVQRLKSAGIDVVLMDNQRSPMILASPQHAAIEHDLAEIGAQLRVPVFSRGALMDLWQREGVSYDHFLASDSVHMNDLGYRCVADALATALRSGLSGDARSRMAVASHAN